LPVEQITCRQEKAMLSHIRLFSLLFLSAHLCLITPSRAETPPGCTSFAGQERRWEMLYGREFYVLLKKRPLAWLPLGILEKHGDTFLGALTD